ncbi:Hsp70 family protein [Virgisporangium aurantiacum]|uniref:Hsp70 protein n=1 Tax=Virgisporangium aurantiacum TaxID=175570 RepID=A0A8J3ZCW1_9ACTN|nr:Hsp70 family protein [Virgisporangium aurantiacum]GIJ59375.1 hypothetical protein Vau01_068910 [Virgisporangium aurantiacum]
MAVDGFTVGIDFGTSTTVAVLARAGGAARPLVFDGSELLPSAVCVGPDGTLLVGRDALHAARSHPGRFEPNPKRSVDDGSLLLGGTEIAVGDVFAAVLARVVDEAGRVAGEPVRAARLTCPAGWGPRRRQLLTTAANAAGLASVQLVAEPVAAASYFVDVLDGRLPTGFCAVVYDFGAGTFDASVVRRTVDGFDVLADRGLPDAGGLDIDAAVVAHLGTVYAARDPERWARLIRPVDGEDRRASQQLWTDVRGAKEMLSRASSTFVHVPLFGEDAPLGRAELETLSRPVLDRTVEATRSVVRDAGVGTEAVAGVFLVGGSSRMPLAATLLHRALGLAPTVIERPELVVAEGGVRAPESAVLVTQMPEPGPRPAPEPQPAVEPQPEPEPQPVRKPGPAPDPPADPDAPRNGRLGPAFAALAVLVLVLVAVVVALQDDGADPSSVNPTATSGSPTQPAKPVRLAALAGAVGPAVFAPDGRTLATAGPNLGVLLWDLADAANPRRVAVIAPEVASVNTMVFTPDGNTLVIAGQGTEGRVYNVADRARPVRVAALSGYAQGLYDIALSPDGRTLATGTLRAVALWDLADPARPVRIATLSGHAGAVGAVAFSADGTAMFTGSDDATIRWTMSDRRQPVPAGSLPGSSSIAICPDGGLLATADRARTGTLWNLGAPTPARVDSFDATGVVFAPTGRTLADVYSSAVFVWAVAADGSRVLSARFDGDSVAFGPDSRTIAVGGDGETVLWRLP